MHAERIDAQRGAAVKVMLFVLVKADSLTLGNEKGGEIVAPCR